MGTPTLALLQGELAGAEATSENYDFAAGAGACNLALG